MTPKLFKPPPDERIMGYVRVALERGIDTEGGLTYGLTRALGDVAVGERVLVPLGRANRPTVGYVVGHVSVDALDASLLEKIKPVLRRDAGMGISLPPELMELGAWIAGYYCCPLGMVLQSMLPAAVKRGTGGKRRREVRAVAAPDGEAMEAVEALTPLQRRVWEAATAAGWLNERALADLAGARTVTAVRALVERGLLEPRRVEHVESGLDLRAAHEAADGTPPPHPSEAQSLAVMRIRERLGQGFGVHLLHGVTGSGKTEVYLRLIEAMLATNEHEHEGGGDTQPASAIVLVPEIALTPQTVGRFLARFPPDLVAVLHSGLTASQRHAQWRRVREGEARIIIGARSAVFAPVGRLGLIIVDEEHDSSYKQDQAPRYSGRDVAIRRGQLAGCPAVLGSATPSLETWSRAIDGPYHLHTLPHRVVGRGMPPVEVVDLREERRHRRGIHLLSQRLEKELAQALDARTPDDAGGKAILLLNRRGYANYIACPDARCGWMMRCDHCDATMVYHVDARLPRGGMVRCHHCLAEQILPATCPDSGHKVSVFGLGTQRVEEELRRKFPKARIARMDSDAMRGGRSYRDTLDAFRRGDLDVLLGTQMLAKGLDFPSVRLVGVICADTSLHLPDFRAAERTFQLVAQVAGRAGRGEAGGRVIVQSFCPDDPAIVAATRHDYVGFATRELELRREMRLPPVTRMARIVLRDKDPLKCAARATHLHQELTRGNDQMALGVRVRPPSPCPISRIADYHRHGIELISPRAAPLQRLLTALRNAGELIADEQTAVDVDPVSLL